VPEPSGLSGFVLAGTVPLWFCSGLVGLAVAPPLGVAVPRWLILAYGVGCALLALLALLVSQPRAQGALEQLAPGGAVVLFDRAPQPLPNDRVVAHRRTIASRPGWPPRPAPKRRLKPSREFFLPLCV
jgi:hypothetical protein